ncbi:TPA: hypothetical protein M8Y61_003838 [Salmonella enterica subsp. enterica serovar Infantis]|nr:hypothetical protein [Salmonella enterica subsp. enterica serovar Infantis]
MIFSVGSVGRHRRPWSRHLSVFKTLIEHQAFVVRFIQQGVDTPQTLPGQSFSSGSTPIVE